MATVGRLGGEVKHAGRSLLTTASTSSLVTSALYQGVQRRRVLTRILDPEPATGPWVLQIGSDHIAAGPSERTLSDLGRRMAGDRALPPLFVDGAGVDPEVPFDRLEARGPTSRVAVGGFRIFDEVAEGGVDCAEFDDFRRRPELVFLDGWRTPRDERLLATYWLARWHDPILWRTDLNDLRESTVGWGTSSPPRPGVLTTTTWAHAYYVSLLSRFFGAGAGLDVIEIGGGYGGLARVRSVLRPDLFSRHTLVDLPMVNELQAWFLAESGVVVTSGVADRGDDGIAVVPTTSATELAPADLVVATQSLTELSVEEILTYVDTTLVPAGAVLLAMQRQFYGLPHLLDWLPRRLVSEGFRVANLDVLEGPNVICILLVR